MTAASMADELLKRPEFYVPDRRYITTKLRLLEPIAEMCTETRCKEISATERDRKDLRATSLAYGEIRFEPFITALMKIRDLYGGLAAPGGKFVDLGSGVGKLVFAAALVHDWEECTGIEILHDLHSEALELQSSWSRDDHLAALPVGTQGVKLSFIEGDITKTEWYDADVVFMNATCFDDALMKDLASTADDMKVGSFLITTTKKIPSGKWKVLESLLEAASWGSTTVFLQQKLF